MGRMGRAAGRVVEGGRGKEVALSMGLVVMVVFVADLWYLNCCPLTDIRGGDDDDAQSRAREY